MHIVSLLTDQVPMPPENRNFVDLSDGISSSSQERFKVFSYNVLCEKAATPQQYGYTPSGALAWDFRKEQILQEIISQDADIVCLQEVDNENFKEFFSMKLAYADYKGVYWPRPRSKTMSEKDAKYVDGCATFYKGSKYILLDKAQLSTLQTLLSTDLIVKTSPTSSTV